MKWVMLVQEVATRERFQLENKVLQREVADQEQQISTHAQELRAHKQNMQEQGEQQVVKLEQQVDDLLSKLKDEQKGKEAAVKVSSQHRGHQQLLQKLLYWLLSCLQMIIGFVTGYIVLASYLSLRLPSFCTDVVCRVSLLLTHMWPQKVGLYVVWGCTPVCLVWV